MELIDIHTHTLPQENPHAIYCCGTEYIADRMISAGVHPWHITDDWKEQFKIVETIVQKENCIAVGECGIDKIKGGDVTVQEKLFRAHAELAEETKKPLIIHCVKGADTILALHKEIKPEQAWIIHGLRGKPEQAIQFTRAGLYLSFGERFNSDSLLATPLDKLLIESDESRLGIDKIYELIAKTTGKSIKELAETIKENCERCGIIL